MKKHIPFTPKLTQSGAWRVQVQVDGKRYSVTDPDKQKVIAMALSLRTKLIRQAEHAEDLTLREAAEDLINRLEGRRSPTTIDGYKKILRTDFQSVLDKKLSRITPRLLDDAVRQMCKRSGKNGKPLSPKTIKNNWAFIAEVLRNYAPGIELKNVILPEVKQTVTVIQNEEEIIRAVIGTSVELPCLLAAWMSLSMSEIKGLTKSKSIRGEYLIVGAETVVYSEGKEIRKSGGKEASRTRTLRMPLHIQNLIAQVPGDVIVPETANSITRRYRTVLKRAGVPYLKFHGLRHLNASIMADLQIDRATARERGGWSNNTIMDRVYTHSLAESRELADEKMDGYFLRVIEGGK